MNALQNCKFCELISPGTYLNTNSGVTVVIDTKGWDYLTAIVDIGVMNIAMSVLTLVESDDNSTNVNIEAANFGNSSSTDWEGTALALPSSTADNTMRVVHLDLRKRKRYIQCLATAGNGNTYLSAIGILSRAEITPSSSTLATSVTGGIVVNA